MSKLSNLRQMSGFTKDVHMVVVSLQELSIIEMDKIRSSVLQTRDFTQGLLDIFLDIRLSQRLQVEKELKKELAQPKTAMLFLSQNQLFSDTNIGQVWQDFVASAEKNPSAELIFIGQVGAELAQTVPAFSSRQTHFIKIPNHNPELNELNDLFAVLRDFTHIIVFHGKFESLVRQESIEQDVTGRESLLKAEDIELREKRSFLFEPDLETLVAYFEKEVEKGIVKQTLHESRLAHLGSRIQTLESARDSIQNKLHKLELQQHRARRQLRTKKQQQRLAGLNLWN